MVRSPSNIELAKELYWTFLLAGPGSVKASDFEWNQLPEASRNQWLAVANCAIERAFDNATAP